jgi:hypothetical protein
MVRKIIDVRDALLCIEDTGVRNTLLLGLAGAVEPASKVRKTVEPFESSKSPIDHLHEF